MFSRAPHFSWDGNKFHVVCSQIFIKIVLQRRVAIANSAIPIRDNSYFSFVVFVSSANVFEQFINSYKIIDICQKRLLTFKSRIMRVSYRVGRIRPSSDLPRSYVAFIKLKRVNNRDVKSLEILSVYSIALKLTFSIIPA